MSDDVRDTGTYQMLLATGGGVSRLEARARKLAREAKDVRWHHYLAKAEVELMDEFLNPNPPQA